MSRPRRSLAAIEQQVCTIVSEQLGVRRSEVHAGLRLVQDLNCDSLATLDLFMRIEDHFCVDLSQDSKCLAGRAVFTRPEFRLSDLAEAVYIQQGMGPRKRARCSPAEATGPCPPEAFTQLGGRLKPELFARPLFEPLGNNRRGYASYRRRTDGMVCVRIPGGNTFIGSDAADTLPDDRPVHQVHLDPYLIDQEPVSTTAYCRFLNSTGVDDEAILRQWFVLSPEDKRHPHELLVRGSDGWSPKPGTERMPMILVSWFGADAYSRWANQMDWRAKEGHAGCLPTEAQWEYAARGLQLRRYPWGDDEPTANLARIAAHARGKKYRAEELPMANVNEDLGASVFGLRHMAGNVWQWCRDWYAPDFYSEPAALMANAANDQPAQIRSERGGSWVGPGFLCRCSYRRGRIPSAKGRCLGFRCVTEVDPIPTSNDG